MSRRLHFDESVGCCFVQWTGDIDRSALLGHMHTMVQEPWFQPDLTVLHDFRSATAVPEYSDISNAADFYNMVQDAFGGGKVAILVPDCGGATPAQMFAFVATGTGRLFHVFFERDQALDWLGLPQSYPDPFTTPAIT